MQTELLEEVKTHWYWRDLQIEIAMEFPTEEPTDPEDGVEWYDPQTCCLCIWDGLEWMCVPLD
jgi:hypothetical protein